MTTLAHPGDTATAESLLPSAAPLQLIDQDGHPGGNHGELTIPDPGVLRRLHRHMVLGRRFDTQATALTKQGRLAVYPSSRGQDACQVGAVLALRRQDWLFPTYRDSVAVLTRGVPAEETLTLLRGDWHCGYDPYEHRVAPQCTPLATNTLHAVGLAHAARLKKQDAGRARAARRRRDQRGRHARGAQLRRRLEGPRGVPRAEQRLRHQRAAGQADRGADARRERDRLRRPRRCSSTATTPPPSTRPCGPASNGPRPADGPTLIEALTYRIEAHTNADDATRYRSGEEVSTWLARDPIARLEAYLRARHLLDDAAAGRLAAEAERLAEDLRQRMNAEVSADPAELFEHVYAQPTAALERQRAALLRRTAGAGGTRGARAMTLVSAPALVPTPVRPPTPVSPRRAGEPPEAGKHGRRAQPGPGRQPGRRRAGRRLRRGRRHARRGLPRHRRAGGPLRRATASSTRRWPSPPSSAPPSAWR